MTREVPEPPRPQVRMEPLFVKTLSAALLIVTVTFAAGYKSGGTIKLMQKLSTPRCGEQEVLPPEALFVLDFIRQHGVTSIVLSKPISENRFLAQPLIESIYPAVVRERGAVYVSYAAEPLPADCEPLKVDERISIATCR